MPAIFVRTGLANGWKDRTWLKNGTLAPGCWGSADVLFSMRVTLKTDDENFTMRTVFKPGEGGYAAFRIPGIVASSRNGSSVLHVFAEGRKYSCADFQGQHDIVYKRSTNAGASFSPLRTLLDPVKLFGNAQCPPERASDKNDCCAFWDPTPIVTRTGKLIVMAQRSWNHRVTPKTNESSQDSR